MTNESKMTKEEAQQAFQEIMDGLERVRVELFTGDCEQSEQAKQKLMNSMEKIGRAHV